MTFFFSARSDGLGERMKALLNAAVLAQHHKVPFKFTWPRHEDYVLKNGHPGIEPEKIFADDFLHRHLIQREELEGLRVRPIRALTALEQNAAIRVEQQSLKGQAPKLAQRIKVRPAYVEAFKAIRFSPAIERMRKAANSIDIGEADALHLRAGDVIFGEYRYLGDYATKALTYPLAEMLAEESHSQRRRLIVFGQDREMCRRIAGLGDVMVAADMNIEADDATSRAFFDIFLMARCQKIFTAGSGFSTFASWISASEIVNPYISEALPHIVERHLQSVPGVDPLYEAHAAWAVLSTWRETLSEVEQLSLAQKAALADPDNGLYRLVWASLLYRSSRPGEAETVLAKAFAHDGPATGSIVRILRDHEQAKASLAPYWPDIEQASQTSNQAAKCLMVRDGWTAGKAYP